MKIYKEKEPEEGQKELRIKKIKFKNKTVSKMSVLTHYLRESIARTFQSAAQNALKGKTKSCTLKVN